MSAERIEACILELIDEGVEEHELPELVAHSLVDEDVAAGEYAGCTPELEAWFCDYKAGAQRALGVEVF